ncbi:MAG: rod shape-determining protein MreD [Acidobacteriaceae bacterium]
MSLLHPSSRREMEEHRFHPLVLILVPLLAIFFQAYLPLRFPSVGFLNVPVLVVIYFAVSRRSPIGGMLLGLIIGIIQDALTHLPLGINGIIDCILGYLAASIGLRIDVDNPGTRLIMNFTFILLASILHVLILRRLLGIHEQWYGLHEVARAVVNGLIGVVLFALLDRLRQRQ